MRPKAGLFAGDILLAFNGKPVKEWQDLLKETRPVVAGTAVSVTVLRCQQESTVMILLKP
jgi:S1-C subfamily serine protease